MGNMDTLDSPRPELGGSHHLPLIVYFVARHEAYIQMPFLSRDSQVGVLKSRWLGLLRLWSPIILQTDLKSKCNLKQSCSSCREFSKGMWHAFCSQVNQVDSRLFVVGS
jgi:hypothetical protein